VRTGIARVAVSARDVSEDDFSHGLGELADMGYELLPPPPSVGDREVAFVLDGDDGAALSAIAVAAARKVFGEAVRPGAVTFLSRGTDDDVIGVAAALGVDVLVSRVTESGGEVVIVHVLSADLERVPEGKLHTALEAALNAEVRITTKPPEG
jgi:hypothetical protein